jgi:4-hydroxy-3-methylbut-2-enyl diphosphate reductase IspH
MTHGMEVYVEIEMIPHDEYLAIELAYTMVEAAKSAEKVAVRSGAVEAPDARKRGLEESEAFIDSPQATEAPPRKARAVPSSFATHPAVPTSMHAQVPRALDAACPLYTSRAHHILPSSELDE